MVKVLVCVAWPYANSPLHLGHVAGSLLPPDIFAKYHALKGDEVLMVSGSDMHGTPITVRAEKEKTTPEEVAERYHRMNKKAIEDLGINFSLFTKTTTQNHFDVTHDVFNKLMEHGYLYRHGAMQYYCPKCAKFLPTDMWKGAARNAVTSGQGVTSARSAAPPTRQASWATPAARSAGRRRNSGRRTTTSSGSPRSSSR